MIKHVFEFNEARNLAFKYRQTIAKFNSFLNDEEYYTNSIRNLIRRTINNDILNSLRHTPIEILGNYGLASFVDTIKRFGYRNLYDVYNSDCNDLLSINGFGPLKYKLVKECANVKFEEFKIRTTIRLNYDNRDLTTSDLVLLIYKYRTHQDFIKNDVLIFKKDIHKVKAFVDDLEYITGPIKWFFSSSETKASTNGAYLTLKEIDESGYFDTFNNIEKKYNSIKKLNTNEAWNDFLNNPIEYNKIIERFSPYFNSNEDRLTGLSKDKVDAINKVRYDLTGLKCTLRNYQEWGLKYILYERNVLLGDEMGLGKTIEAIASMVHLRNQGYKHFIVVCPFSVLINWDREISRHSDLESYVIHGKSIKTRLKLWKLMGGVAVVNYEGVKNIALDKDLKLGMVVVDEAHFIKNPNTIRTSEVLRICKNTNRKLFMTGTALENNLGEMLNLISMLKPAISSKINYDYYSNILKYRSLVAPVYLRRKRIDVLSELPELIENEDWCSMTSEDMKYEVYLDGTNYMDCRRVSWNVNEIKNSSKFKRLLEIVNEAKEENRKVLIFSYFLKTIDRIYEYFKDEAVTPITGKVSSARRQAILDEFEASTSKDILVAQIESGGTGLNIQSASVVIICEPQLKPSTESQAISRSYRMGQARNVLVHRLYCLNTIDEAIYNTLKSKLEVFKEYADQSQASELLTLTNVEATAEDIMSEYKKIKGKTLVNKIENKEDTESETIKEESNNNLINDEVINSYDTNDLANEPNSYYDNLLKMPYDEIVDLLLNKYGKAKYDYFCTEACVSKNKKVTRTSEGLICHHIDEDKAILLSNDKFAKMKPFDYQKADRLVYCNYLEHFILHIKILEKTINENNKNEFRGIGGAVAYIGRDINTYYSGYTFTKEYLINCMSKIKDNYDSYIKAQNYLWRLIKNNPLLSIMIRKADLCYDYKGLVVDKIFNSIQD